MVSPGPNRRAGFSLIELLVAMALMSLVLLLLFRGVQAVSETVIQGQRRSELRRRLTVARRVLKDDVEAMAQHPRWAVWAGDFDFADPPPLPARVLAFLRYREGTGEATETEWVQYWVEKHPEEDRLYQWVRYSGPADDRREANPDWWEEVLPEGLTSEIVLDELVDVEMALRTDEGTVVDGAALRTVEAVDARLACALPPLPVVPAPSTNFSTRMRQEDGDWMEFRLRPAFRTHPPPGGAP